MLKTIERHGLGKSWWSAQGGGRDPFRCGLALVRIVGAILRGQNSVLSVSVMLEGEYGLNQVCLGVPCLLSTGGVAGVLKGMLPADEQAALEASARILQQAYDSL